MDSFHGVRDLFHGVRDLFRGVCMHTVEQHAHRGTKYTADRVPNIASICSAVCMLFRGVHAHRGTHRGTACTPWNRSCTPRNRCVFHVFIPSFLNEYQTIDLVLKNLICLCVVQDYGNSKFLYIR